eukprot:TRINITY_DN11209_c0_g1_i1.p1 TRINITY_DN11209_c0_g1~~TRINITY_DN11209_c0_g1_i1.p1  ORF type:complete len:137 (+),score=0.96 TRINITY_DN11209_c0_g1_i1:57-413(+)
MAERARHCSGGGCYRRIVWPQRGSGRGRSLCLAWRRKTMMLALRSLPRSLSELRWRRRREAQAIRWRSQRVAVKVDGGTHLQPTATRTRAQTAREHCSMRDPDKSTGGGVTEVLLFLF